MSCRVCSTPKPRLWHANPTETRDVRLSCGGIGHCSNPRPINKSGRVLGFGLIGVRSMGPIRAINPHRRRMARRLAPSDQSDQSFLRSFGRTNSTARIGRRIVGGIPIGPMNATNGGPRLAPDGQVIAYRVIATRRAVWSRRNRKPDPNQDAIPVGGLLLAQQHKHDLVTLVCCVGRECFALPTQFCQTLRQLRRFIALTASHHEALLWPAACHRSLGDIEHFITATDRAIRI